MLEAPFILGGGISVSAFILHGQVSSMQGYHLSQNGIDVYQKWHLSLFSFKFICFTYL